jgi:hypothetical protein
MRVYGNASRAGVGGEGVEVPIEPLLLSEQLVVARRERQAAAIAAAESRQAPPATAAKSRAARRRQGGFVPGGPAVPVAHRPPASFAPVAPARTAGAVPPVPPPAAPVVEVIEVLVPSGPVACEAPGCSQKVTPEFVARTGERIHPPCRKRMDASTSGGALDATRPARPAHRRGTTAANRTEVAA